MEGLLTQAFLSALLFGAVTAGMPLLLAGLGEQISEKAGVLNIGIEGMMLFGAYGGFVAAYYSGSFWLGFLAGGVSGMVVAALIDRKSVVEGKSVSVRVDLGGRRIIKKKKITIRMNDVNNITR